MKNIRYYFMLATVLVAGASHCLQSEDARRRYARVVAQRDAAWYELDRLRFCTGRPRVATETRGVVTFHDDPGAYDSSSFVDLDVLGFRAHDDCELGWQPGAAPWGAPGHARRIGLVIQWTISVGSTP